MRVALDARTLQESHPGGVARGLANVLPELAQLADLHLLFDHRRPVPSLGFPSTRLHTPVPGVSASWLQLSAPRWLRGFDGIFHCPYYGLPAWLPVPGVVTIHDITFEHFPHWFTRRQGLSFRLQARRAARTAAVIIAVTEFVKADLVAAYGVDPDRVMVAPQAIAPAFTRPVADPEILGHLNLERPYILAMGGARRRNLALAVAAWHLVDLGVDLVVVGRDSVPLAPRLRALGSVTDAQLAALFSGCLAFLYPTAYEGFGMPALEAMACGAVVVAAPNGSLPEVLGDAAVWSPSLDVVDLAEALRTVVQDGTQRETARRAGLARAASWPTWADAAKVHLAAYRMAHTGAG